MRFRAASRSLASGARRTLTPGYTVPPRRIPIALKKRPLWLAQTPQRFSVGTVARRVGIVPSDALRPPLMLEASSGRAQSTPLRLPL